MQSLQEKSCFYQLSFKMQHVLSFILFFGIVSILK